MKNKTKRIYGRLLALSLSALLIMTGLSVTALAAGENLLTTINPSFEGITLNDEDPTAGTRNDKFYQMKYIDLGADGGHTGDNYLKFRQIGAYIAIRVPVEAAKNYDFSFWMRNSLEKSLELGYCQFYSTVNDTFASATTMMYGTGYSYEFGRNERLLTFGNGIGTNTPTVDEEQYKFGITRTGEASDAWRQVTINFTTPPYSPAGNNATHVELVLNCLQTDEKLAVDDFSVVETGKKPNRIFNGYFEAVQTDKDTEDVPGVFFVPNTNGNIEVNVCEENGNRFLKLECGEGAEEQQVVNIVSNTAAYLEGRNTGTRYKLSFKAKAVGKEGQTEGNLVGIELNKGSSDKFGSHFYDGCTEKLTSEWKTYNYYLDSTSVVKRSGAVVPTSGTAFVIVIDPGYELYLDDVSSWYDESDIGFYKSLDFYSKNGDRRFEVTSWFSNNFFQTADTDTFMTETGIEAASLSALAPDETTGERKVKVRAHYLPEQTWGAWDDAAGEYALTVKPNTEITLLSAVYKYDAGGNKTLHEVFIDSETAVNGETIDVVTEVTVPKATNGETYTVEAMAWDMNGMKSIMDKAVLN